MGYAPILEFDRSPGISEIDRLQSFMESVQRAFNEFEISADDLNLSSNQLGDALAGADFKIVFNDYGSYKVLNAESFQAKKGDFKTLSAENLLVAGGFLAKELNASTGSYSKYLAGVEIYGDLIKAGTLRADRLIIKGSDGKYYNINTDFTAVPGVTPVEEDTIHGSVLVAESITANKINTEDLFSQNITVRGDFYLGQGGVLEYNAKDDALYMKAKQIDAASDDGLILRNGKKKEVLRLGEEGDDALISLMSGSAKMKANASGGLSITSQNLLDFHTKLKTTIESWNADDGIKVAEIIQNTAGTSPEMILSCRKSTGSGISGGNGYFEKDILDKAYVKITEKSTSLVYDNPHAVADENNFTVDANGMRALITTLTGVKEAFAVNREGQFLVEGNVVADVIVSHGQTDGWWWQKWASGKAVAWKQYNITITKWSAWGSLYEASPQIGSYSIPSGIFNQTPNFACRAQCPGIGISGVETHGAGSSTSTPQFWLLRPNDPGATGVAMVLIEAIGRWK